jgi:hypothetical protein
VADPITLRAASGLPADPPALGASTLIMIDCQNTYTRGPLELDGVQAALDQAEELLDRARSAGIPVIHIQHDAGPGSVFDVRGESGAIVDRVAPRADEPTIVNAPRAVEFTHMWVMNPASSTHRRWSRAPRPRGTCPAPTGGSSRSLRCRRRAWRRSRTCSESWSRTCGRSRTER